MCITIRVHLVQIMCSIISHKQRECYIPLFGSRECEIPRNGLVVIFCHIPKNLIPPKCLDNARFPEM